MIREISKEEKEFESFDRKERGISKPHGNYK